ncbi:MAG: DUF4290 domain-containing protein [Dysgonamonadaceae bacterium]|nr:DUF4290 domain-containing protein [Dysgonamonadaceae bacterium]MDD4728632.1 DUF4290 domain-containing protein [Dysgonamonadaceae bacterium]
MEYNTQLKKLILPEYGRNIQNMVNYCVDLEDKEQRTKCANSLIDIMGNMFPHLRNVNDFKHILWDHLAIMSDFKLDIDYPYEIIKKEELIAHPSKIEYSRPTMKYRHYGKTLERMIDYAVEMEEGEEKKQLIHLLLTQMKKSYTQWNREVDDATIISDLHELSNGKIKIDHEDYNIPTFRTQPNISRHRSKAIKNQRRR